MISIVVPAHNEERVIGRFLTRLLAGADEVEYELIIACNGCTDNTAQIARTLAPRATVIELETASKPLALNTGDAHATSFPRFYIDADVEVDIRDLLLVADTLNPTGHALAGAPRLRMDTSRSPWPVRSYMRVWRELPYIRNGLVGVGIFGLSRIGRSRFGAFPDVIADDLFVQGLFTEAERIAHPDAEFTAHAPRTSRDLIRRLTRAHAGNVALQRDGLSTTRGHRAGDFFMLALSRPRLTIDLPAYGAISIAVRFRAHRKLGGSNARVWDRDDSSRTAD